MAARAHYPLSTIYYPLRIILIIIAASAVFLIGNNQTALWDRDEPRYAQTSRQMMQSGDWVVPRLLDQVRTAKPIFIYWCQASAMKVFGDNDFAARFPSSVAMVLTLILVAIVVGRFIGLRRAMWTVFILASNVLILAAAKMCLTDSVLLLFVTIAQLCLAMIYTQRGPRFITLLIMWIAIGFAGLTKGPVVLAISFTTMVALAIFDVGKDWRSGVAWRSAIGWWARLNPILGILILAVICGPWLILIHLRSPGFLQTSFGHEVVDRMRSGLEGHKGPPGYYLLLIWGTFFPWSLLLPATVVQAWKRRHLPAIRFAIAAIIGPWVLFECVQTKLPFYILPIFPMLAFLTADMLIGAERKVHTELNNRGFVRVVIAWSVVVLVAGSIPWICLRFFRSEVNHAAIIAMSLASLCAAGVGVLAIIGFRSQRPGFAAKWMGVGTMAIVAILYVGFFPNADFLRLSPRVASILHADHADHAIMIDYKEDTLPWYEGGTIRGQRENDFLTATPPGGWPEWIVLTGDIWQKTPPPIQQKFDVQGPIHGWAYSDSGRIVDLYVLRKK